MYVKHTWVSNKPVCTVVLLMQSISFTNYIRCTKPLENGCGSIFLSPPGKRQTFFFFLKPCYDIICTNTKRTAAFIPQYGFEWNPCLHFINTAFSPTSPWALEEEWTEKYSWVDDWKCVCVCLFSIFGKLIQEELLYKNCCKMNSWTEQVCKGRLGFRPFKTRSETGFQYL